MGRTPFLLLVVGSVVATPAQAQEARVVPVIHDHVIRSNEVDEGEEYLIRVGLPDGYHRSDRSYPLVVVLDGEKSFGLVRDAADWLTRFREIRPAIVVGVLYGEDSEAWWQKRSRDLTPSLDESRVWGDWPLAGGADQFRMFLLSELVPFLDARYRLSGERALVGISFGGLFAAYDLLQEDRLFDSYVIVSPAYAWDREHIFELEGAFASKSTELDATIFSAVGEHDEEVILDPWRRFDDRLRSREYPGLVLQSTVFPGEAHISVFPAAVSRGLRLILNR